MINSLRAESYRLSIEFVVNRLKCTFLFFSLITVFLLDFNKRVKWILLYLENQQVHCGFKYHCLMQPAWTKGCFRSLCAEDKYTQSFESVSWGNSEWSRLSALLHNFNYQREKVRPSYDQVRNAGANLEFILVTNFK